MLSAREVMRASGPEARKVHTAFLGSRNLLMENNDYCLWIEKGRDARRDIHKFSDELMQLRKCGES